MIMPAIFLRKLVDPWLLVLENETMNIRASSVYGYSSSSVRYPRTAANGRSSLLTLLLCLFFVAPTLEARASLVTTLNPRGRAIAAETATGGAFISLADFQALLTLRNDPANAGVFDSENVASAGALASVEPDYATANFTISGAARYGRNDASVGDSATSGSRFGFVNGSETWTFGSKTANGVSHVGALFYNWSTGGSANLVSVTATFDDNSTATYNATAATQQYSFVGFAAPPGRTIATIQILETAGGDWVMYDDVAVVLVPEPTSTALFALGLLLLFRLRRIAG